MDKNIAVYTPTDFNQITYIEIFPQGSNLILIVIHTRPAFELHDDFGGINQFLGKLLNDLYIIS